ncbi:hypothetical protein chiPu_0017449 [Chiloscyllium punctatum]|uniref:Prolyl 4-hydroxylase alpha subunit domain-containing protein n=1 Tax=Chiloscyllium punctatum TaxID=137246 RepID=A0A401RG42_CHIPU|nr:hypothetical protein [Chiloscyllium punctatum]
MALWLSWSISLLLAAGSWAQEQEQGRAPLEPYDRLFSAAVEAYYRNDWQGVIINMERALQNQVKLRLIKIHCWTLCNNNTRFAISSSEQNFFFDTNFFNTVLKKADCLKQCEEEKLGPYSMHQISEEMLLEFQKRNPYNYLQMAYFKIKKLDKAVAAAYTFYVVNPEHMEMRQNLEYYRLMAGVKDSDFRDLEAKPHMEAFRTGVRYYSDEQFESAIEFLENALGEYFKADMECRALCEGPYNFDGYSYMEYNADLFQAITDHYIQVLNCKQNCVTELATRPDRETPIDDFLPTHFDYLQFAYYNTEDYSKAIECAKTYLLFYPNDEVMNQNLQYYQAVLGEEQAASLNHRENIQRYINNSLLEKELLYFANEIFGVTFIDPDKWTPEDVMPVKLKEKQKVERETAARISKEIGNLMKEIEHLVDEKTKESSEIVKMVREGGPLLYNDVKVTMNAKVLNGTQRVVLDSVITGKECEELRYLSNETNSPPSQKALGFDDVPISPCAWPTLDRKKKKIHNEPWPPVHQLTCAILYLNHDFEGGDFIFTEIDAKNITAKVKPRCGRVVGFSSGAENPHGVQAVTKGQRCAVALWFTLDPRHKERERIAADDLVKMLFGAEEELQQDEDIVSAPESDDAPTEASPVGSAPEPPTTTTPELEREEEEAPVSESSIINTSDPSPGATTPALDQKEPAIPNVPPEKEEL